MSNKPTAEYLETVKELDSIVRDCILVSLEFTGIQSQTGAQFYASVLFASLCTRAVTLAIVTPFSPWSKKKLENWDFSSIAGLVRSILEVRLAFYYLCAETLTPEDWDCRWNIFNLHDCNSRIRLFQEMLDKDDEIRSFERQADELRQRLITNTSFNGLPEPQKRELLKGKNAYLFSLEEIGVRAGVNIRTFRLLYKLLSSHAHGLPMSFYRNEALDRGRGVHSLSEEQYTSLCLTFAISLLKGARDEMRVLFTGVADS